MFYTFNQNNSGGSFDFDEKIGITHFVIIEADSYNDAIDKAKDIGIYFNGVAKGCDCSCCGDRWYEPWDDEGTEEPKIYGWHPSEHFEQKWSYRFMKEGREICIHYKDGRKEWF